MITPFYNKVSRYSQSILANTSGTKDLKMHPKLQLNQRWFLGRHFRSNKSKISKTKTKHLPQISCRGIGMFVKQQDKLRLQD